MRRKPDIVFITSDQHRGDVMGCADHPCARTPHLDKLAQMGIRFNRAYADCPVCIPQRTTLVTGIQSHVYGMPNYASDYRIDLDRQDFLGSLMTEAGYQTQLVGKTHWHTEPSFRAGFEHVMSEIHYHDYVQAKTGNGRSDQSGIGMNELFPDLSHHPAEWSMTQWVIDRSIEFLKYRDRTQPYFLWASFVDPHPPNTIHEPYYSMYDHEDIPEPVIPQWLDTEQCPYELFQHRSIWNSVRMKPRELRKAKGVYYGKVTNLDHQLGRLLGKIDAYGSLENTLIVYTSDHGEMLGDLHDMGKSTFLEPSTSVPMIICPPKDMGIKPGQVSEALIGLDDLLPTFCECAGITPPQDITGKSILPIINGSKTHVREDYHGQIGNSHMFHTGAYKYLYFADDGKELLFDAVADRKDEYNLATTNDQLLFGIRDRFIAHLIAENHDHVQNGKLVNLRTEQEAAQELQARNYYGWV